jgi:selenocysteine lyase/cysteine desulfurase
MDTNPVEYLEKNNDELTRQVLHAAGRYLGVDPTHVALTDSTTMGVGLVYSGLKLRSGDDILTTEHDYYVTHESLRLLAERSGAQIRKISLFESGMPGDDEAVSRIIDSILPKTRLVALTWVHSSTGWKIPVSAIANAVREINSKRDDHDQVLIGLDGVHGFGVEDTSFAELGCDFLMTGCHKWLFGPRGTGIIVFSERGLRAVQPSIPTFDDSAVFGAWLEGRAQPDSQNNGARMTPGGFKAFEHRWALKEAFELHEHIGKSRIARRTHELASRLKEGLSSINGVVLRTPLESRSSAGIVSFDVEDIDPKQAVSTLRERGVIASVSPYATPYVRLTPSIRNTNEDLDKVLNVIGQVA